jgi:hypothetical protein
MVGTLLAGSVVFGADQIFLQFKPAGSQGELDIHSSLGLPVSAAYPEYTILCSTNLVNWSPLSGTLTGATGVSDEFLRTTVPFAGNYATYRVVATTKIAGDGPFGEAVYGYATEFSQQLQSMGQLPLDQFATRYSPTNVYLPVISFDPTTAEYWNNFSNRNLFRLNANEFAIFQTNGFVVSQRLGTYSFADAFYRIFTNDLPVYFSADAALHAWHRSYDAMLEELEEVFMARYLTAILNGMGGQVTGLSANASGTALANGVLDADMFLAVGRSLATGTNNYGSLGQNSRIQTVLDAVNNLQPAQINLFGAYRTVDFSQLQVRGHYTSSQTLQRYFRAMMWCSLIDYRFTGSTNDNSLRELSGAVAMNMLMSRSGQFFNWQRMDNVIQMFVGLPDSLNFAQLSDLLTAANISNPSDLPTTAALQSLQSKIMSGQLGAQNIRSGYFYSPLTRARIKLPRSFTAISQRFTFDGWALSKFVFDSVIWDDDGIPGFEDKVMRRVPSALDVAFSVLGNNQTVPDLLGRISNSNGVAWRDGYRYQHNLAAMRNVIDGQDSGVWTNNIYNMWLGCLRELSQPTTGVEYPECMRTRAWAMKTLNTQLASWTQLKHDTVLYAKQPYTGEILCLYPDGFIEPRPTFWARMRDMALSTSNLMSTLPTTGQVVFEPNSPGDTYFTNSLADIYTNRLQFLSTFATNMTALMNISQKELSHQVLTADETAYLQNLIELMANYGGGIRRFNGWYPAMFYHNMRALHGGWLEPSDLADQLVTDIFTDPPEPVITHDPGCVLHEGVGNVFLLMMAVDSGPGSRAVYAGPVLSHYEFQKGPTTRETDQQWQSDLSSGLTPPQPDWTRCYLVPNP